MIIKKTFVQRYVSNDQEGRYWDWEDTDRTYEDLKENFMNEFGGWYHGIRLIEKIFDDETFTITIKPIKEVTRKIENLVYLDEIEEKIF